MVHSEPWETTASEPPMISAHRCSPRCADRRRVPPRRGDLRGVVVLVPHVQGRPRDLRRSWDCGLLVDDPRRDRGTARRSRRTGDHRAPQASTGRERSSSHGFDLRPPGGIAMMMKCRLGRQLLIVFGLARLFASTFVIGIGHPGPGVEEGRGGDRGVRGRIRRRLRATSGGSCSSRGSRRAADARRRRHGRQAVLVTRRT